MLRFESSLYFGNVERFRNALVVATGLDPSTQQEPRKEIALANNDSDEKDELLENENNGQDYNCNGEIPNGVSNIALAKIEWFSIECRETKTKAITMANQNRPKQLTQ